MKSRSTLLLENSLHAAISAIEIYNKPKFVYKEEICSILLVNAWELCLKAKYLKEHHNKLTSLYIPLEKAKKDGKKYKIQRYKINRAGNYFTIDIKGLLGKIDINSTLRANLNALIEIRDNAIHYLNNPTVFQKTFLEIVMASITGYSTFVESEFNVSLKDYNFSIIPISFNMSKIIEPASLHKESPELKKLLAYLINIREHTELSGDYAVALNIDVKVSKSKEGALLVKYDKEGIPVFEESEEIFKKKYPLTYDEVVKKLKSRYFDFKQNDKFHKIKKVLEGNPKYAKARLLDFNNPKSSRKTYYSPEIIKEFDKNYQKR